MKELLKKIEDGTVQSKCQTSAGKIFYEADFKPYHLRVTNSLMENGLLKEYLRNKDQFPEARIFSQF